MKRREFLTTVIAVAAAAPAARAAVVNGAPSFPLGDTNEPDLVAVKDGELAFFTPEEANIVGAIADRLIPADELSIGGKEAGCVQFIDRQLAGSYGRAVSLYRLGRFIKGTPEQGTQSSHTPIDRYRSGLAGIEKHCRETLQKSFTELSAEQQDGIIADLEKGALNVGDVDSKELFEQVLQNVREGYLSDPIYGGNKGMASWRMIGFPGARYDFRDVIDQKGQKLDITPVSLVDRSL